MNRAARLALLAATALACGCGEPQAPAPARRVILITCDTLRADRLGAYGYGRPTTPNLDAFAGQAVLFELAYTSAPVTDPALSSLMTGRLPDEIGVAGGNRLFMPASVETLAELASAAGLPTGAVVSNWVLRRPEPAYGDVGLPQGFDHYDDRMTEPELNRDFAAERDAPDTTDAAIAWLSARRDRGEDRFLFWVHYQDPHGPYTPPEPIAQRFASPPGDEPPLALSTTVYGQGAIPSYQALGGERRPGVYRDRYDAEVAYIDEHVGRLLDWLREQQWWDDSLIVFTADHGEALGEHDSWFCHGENAYAEAVRVPLIVRFPRMAAADAVANAATSAATAGRRAELVGHIDLFPTVVEALGLPARAARGRSLFQSWPGSRLLVQTLSEPGRPCRWHGLTDGRWRLVTHEGSPSQLFDLAADPREEHDLAAARPEIVAEMERTFAELLRSAERVAPLSERTVSPEEEARLKSMGYAGGDDQDC